MKKLIWIAIPALLALAVFAEQQSSNPQIFVSGGAPPKLAIPDLLGSGDAQKYMGAFNETLWSDVKGSGMFDMVPKTSLPTFIPQQPADFQTPAPPPQP